MARRPDLAAVNYRDGHSVRGARTDEYEAWVGMRKRCNNPKHKRYPEWGGKGIAVCPEWRHDFAAFLHHIGPRPSPTHSVDRIDGKKGYEPGNVRWATKTEQSNNRPSFCRLIEYCGRVQTMAEWAREVGINRECLKQRLNMGW